MLDSAFVRVHVVDQQVFVGELHYYAHIVDQLTIHSMCDANGCELWIEYGMQDMIDALLKYRITKIAVVAPRASQEQIVHEEMVNYTPAE